MTETCSYCGQEIGDRELQHMWILGGERYIFHAKPDCREAWKEANGEMIAKKLTLDRQQMQNSKGGLPGALAFATELVPLLKDIAATLTDLSDRLKRIEDELNIRASKESKRKTPNRSNKKSERVKENKK